MADEDSDSNQLQVGRMLEAIFRTGPIPMIITRVPTGEYLMANDAFLRMSGWSETEIIGRTTLEVARWHDPEERARFVKELVKNGFVSDWKAQFETKSGEIRTAVFSTQVAEFEGEPAAFSIAHDITEEHTAEQAIADNEARLRLILSEMPAVVWTTDTDLNILSSEGAGLATMGTSTEEAVGSNLRAAYGPASPTPIPVAIEMHEKALAGVAGTYRTDFAERTWEAHVEAIRGAEGEITGTIGVTLDITDRLESERELRQYADRLDVLYQMDQAIRSSRSAEDIAQDAVEHLRRLIGCERVSVAEFDLEHDEIVGVAVSTESEIRLERGVGRPIGSFLDRLRNDSLITPDVALEKDLPLVLETLKNEGMHSLLNVPIAAEDDLIGSLNLASTKPSYFSEEHVDIATEVAGQLAIAIQQARLYEQVKQYAGELEQRLAELRQTHDERRRLLARLVRAQEEERRSIASDIHDDSIQKMAAVGLRLAALKRRTTDEKTGEMLDRLEESVQLSIDRLRHLMFELWPPALERHGLAAAVRNELDELHSESDIETRLEEELDEEPDPEIRTIAFRIIQEAVSNTMKHSNAKTLSVRLENANGGVHAIVRDDGVGMVPATSGESPPGHLGLSGMRERADMAGGWLELNSDTGDGTVVEFWLPSQAGGQSPGAT